MLIIDVEFAINDVEFAIIDVDIMKDMDVNCKTKKMNHDVPSTHFGAYVAPEP